MRKVHGLELKSGQEVAAAAAAAAKEAARETPREDTAVPMDMDEDDDGYEMVDCAGGLN
jgi:hypothetical protein